MFLILAHIPPEANVAHKTTTHVNAMIAKISIQRYNGFDLRPRLFSAAARKTRTQSIPVTSPIGYIHFSKVKPLINKIGAPPRAAPINALKTLRLTVVEKSIARVTRNPTKPRDFSSEERR
jgi:hypothetical protein